MRDFSRSRYARPVALEALEADHRKMLFEGPALIMGKTHTMSQVHRRGLMDDVTIRRTAPDGQRDGLRPLRRPVHLQCLFRGGAAYPGVARQAARSARGRARPPGSHNYKELVAAFNSFPKEELFRAPVAELREQLHLILDLKDEAAVRVSPHYDPVRNNVVALVVMPRENFLGRGAQANPGSARPHPRRQAGLLLPRDGRGLPGADALLLRRRAAHGPRRCARWRPRSRRSRARGRIACARN